jgi:hypothetical protein
VPVTIVGFDVTPEQGANIIAIPSLGTPVLEILGQGTTAVDRSCPDGDRAIWGRMTAMAHSCRGARRRRHRRPALEPDKIYFPRTGG